MNGKNGNNAAQGMDFVLDEGLHEVENQNEGKDDFFGTLVKEISDLEGHDPEQGQTDAPEFTVIRDLDLEKHLNKKSSEDKIVESEPELEIELADAVPLEVHGQKHDSSEFETAVVEPQKIVPLNANPHNADPGIDLKNVDYVQKAQEKVLRLEKELTVLRKENQELAIAGDHFKTLSEEQARKLKTLEGEVSHVESTSQDEKKILLDSLSAKDLKIDTLQARVEELEEQLRSKFNRLRVRERELESRLEILKQETETLTKSKDHMIVDLKKQLGALNEELDRARTRGQKFSEKLTEKEDALRRTVKALKLSLTMLESQKNED